MIEVRRGELPRGWAITRLGEICLDTQYGWTTSASNEGKLHLLRTTDITSGSIDWGTVPFCKETPAEKERYLLHDGDIVISRAGSVGYSQIIKNPPEAIFASYLIRFKTLINKSYIAYFLKSPSYWKSISEKSLGIAVPNVNASKLRQIIVPLPPLPEQHRIVTKIEELFTRLSAGVEALKKTKTQLKRYRQAVLKYAFEGKLTQEWREANKGKIEPAFLLLERITEQRKKKAKRKFKELPPIDTSELPELPEGWAWTVVTNIGEVVTGTTPSKARNEYYGKDYPFYKPTDLNDGYYVRRSEDGLSEEGISKARLLPLNSVLVTCIGATIGKTGFIRREGASNQQVNAIIVEKGILPEYVYFTCISPQFQKAILDNASATTLPILNKSRFEILSIPIPPFEEQQKIVEEIENRLSITDHLEIVTEHGIKQSERLGQSILKKAFEGKLVPQDPTDEPAEKLLERIKEEKTKRESERKTKKGRKVNQIRWS